MEVGGTSAAAGARPLTPEEEARRRNTDCIFFLDPLLTCKKGNECDFRHSEGARKNRTDCRYWLNGNCLNPKCSFRHPGNECAFRHSEGARMNPRDCRYWLNGNCLNPKCSFRHPPIDGMLGAPTPEIPAVSSHYAAYNSGKQMVPCYYFQKGNCLKGDRCSFYHGPQSAGNNPPEQVAKVFSFPLEQPPTQKNDLLGTKESAQPNNSIPQGGPIIDGRSKMTVDWLTTNSAKTASAVTPAEPASNAVKSWPKSEKVQNSMPAVKKSFTTSSGEDHPECYQNHIPVESDPMQDWSQNYQVPPTDDLPQNSREADEFLGESSPGFDVLVDNDADAAAYLPDEEDFGRDMYPVDDYEYAPADFDIRAHHDRERFNGMGEKGQIGQMYDGYERKHRRTSSERNMDRPFHSERRFLQRERDPVEMDGSDLRHRLRRRINGSSSAISPERNGERRRRDDHYRERAQDGHYTHRDHHQGPRGSTLSTRLQGRIKLPGRSPDRADTRSEKERDRRRPRDMLSPVRHMDFQGGRHREAGQHQEKTRRRSSELDSSARNADGQHSRRDVMDSLNFATRKNFGESRKANESVESEASLDFEGPKPLSIILQRKREAAWGNGSSAHNVKEDKSTEVSHRQQPGSLVEAEKEGYDNIISSEECKSGSGDEEYKEEGQIPVEGHGQSSSHGDKLEVGDIIEVDPVGNQEADNYDQREGESDYETIEGHDYKSEDENAYQEDEEEFEDDDDFARKVGVVFS